MQLIVIVGVERAPSRLALLPVVVVTSLLQGTLSRSIHIVSASRAFGNQLVAIRARRNHWGTCWTVRSVGVGVRSTAVVTAVVGTETVYVVGLTSIYDSSSVGNSRGLSMVIVVSSGASSRALRDLLLQSSIVHTVACSSD